MRITHLDILKAITGSNNWPVTGVFGEDAWPRTKPHDGTDYAMPVGTPLCAPENAKIVFEHWGVSKGGDVSFGQDYGNYTGFYVSDWDHTFYVAHTKYNESEVNKGERIAKGSRITLSGNTGLTTGPHVHIGAAKGRHTTLSSARANAIDFETLVIDVEETSTPAAPKPPVKNKVGMVLVVRDSFPRAEFTAYEDLACTIPLKNWTISNYDFNLQFMIVEDHDPVFKCKQYSTTPVNGIKYIYIKYEPGMGFDKDE